MARFTGTERYIASRDLEVAVNAAVTLQRPLLIKGEPGTGKTMLAHEVAAALGHPLIEWHVKSTTKAQQGLYEYDAVSRLRDGQLGDARVHDIGNYIVRGKAVGRVRGGGADRRADRRGRQGGYRISRTTCCWNSTGCSSLSTRRRKTIVAKNASGGDHYLEQREGTAGRVPAALLLPLHPLSGPADDGADRGRRIIPIFKPRPRASEAL